MEQHLRRCMKGWLLLPLSGAFVSPPSIVVASCCGQNTICFVVRSITTTHQRTTRQRTQTTPETTTHTRNKANINHTTRTEQEDSTMAMESSTSKPKSSVKYVASVVQRGPPATAPEYVVCFERYLHMVTYGDGTKKRKGTLKRRHWRRALYPPEYGIETKMLDEVDNGEVVLHLAFDIFRLWRRQKEVEDTKTMIWKLKERMLRKRTLSEFMQRFYDSRHMMTLRLQRQGGRPNIE